MDKDSKDAVQEAMAVMRQDNQNDLKFVGTRLPDDNKSFVTLFEGKTMGDLILERLENLVAELRAGRAEPLSYSEEQELADGLTTELRLRVRHG